MLLEGFGIQLQRLREEDIELVRVHRNSDTIRRYMEFREEITPEMQRNWFASVNNEFNNYFIIISDGKKTGLIYGALIDWEKKETGNGGIFIWDKDSLESPATLAASLLLTDTTFLIGLERSYIKVLKNNPSAIAFDTAIGYRLLPGQDEVENQRYVLEEDIYLRKTEKFRSSFVRKYGDRIRLIIENINDPMEKKIADIIRHSRSEKTKRFELVIP